ncbi:MAG: McbB family protein [Lachnospiraceae bacterium]|nr:McbB family protein [Lachnospiraceae bacterium]
MYKIQPFIWQKIEDNKTFFQTQYSSVVITNNKLRDFLIKIEQDNILELDKKYIESYFFNETGSVINFLTQNKLFKEKVQKFLSVERLVILSNDNAFSNSVQMNLKGIYIIEELKEADKELFLFKENDLLIVFLNPFNLEKINKIDSFVKEKNILVKFIYPYNNKIYFTNFYKKSWYNPCPMCFFYMLESQLRGENEEYNINFQTILDLLYAQKATFDIHLPLDASVYLQIVYFLSGYLRKIQDDYKIDEVLEICLEDFSVNRDIACHWGYCDCYE